MSDSNRSRSPKGNRSNTRARMFEVREEPLPPPPQPLQNMRDPFEDPPTLRPRTAKRASAAPGVRQPDFILGDERQEYLPSPARGSLMESAAELRQARIMSQRLHEDARPVYRAPEPGRSIPELIQQHPWLLGLVCLICVAIILVLSPPRQVVFHSGRDLLPWSDSSVSSLPPAANTPPGEHSILGVPTISAEGIDAVLASYGSPAHGTGRVWIELGQRYGIDPAYALAFFIHESSAGTNPGWAGVKPGGGTTHNIGNIICAGYATCFGRFRDYASWEAGIEDWYRLINREYVGDRGISTIERIIPVYAPSFENNVPAYVQAVVGLVDQWRRNGGRP